MSPPKSSSFDVQVGRVPRSELNISFARSGGPGGQHVNKKDTKAILHWNVEGSEAFSEAEKERLLKKLSNRINATGELVMSFDNSRSQATNLEKLLENFRDVINEGLAVKKKRKPTKPTKASKERRLQSKKERSQKRASRSKKWDEGI